MQFGSQNEKKKDPKNEKKEKPRHDRIPLLEHIQISY